MIRKEKSYLLSLPALLLLAVWFGAVRIGALAALLPETEGVREYRLEIIEPKEAPVVIVVRQELPELLEIAAKYNGYVLKLSSPVSGTVENTSLPMQIEDLMSELGAMFNLKWHFADSKLFVSTATQKFERHLELKGLEVEELQVAIRQHGISPDDYELQVHSGRDAVSVIGPASYLDGIALVLKELTNAGTQDE